MLRSQAISCLRRRLAAAARSGGSGQAGSSGQPLVPLLCNVRAFAATGPSGANSATPGGDTGSASKGEERDNKRSLRGASGGKSQPEAAVSVDPETGLPLYMPPPHSLRDEVEEITIFQLEEMLRATTGAAADPGVRAAAEEALEAMVVCESCSQELDQAGQWESLLSTAGFINSPQDYAGMDSEGAGAGGKGTGTGAGGSSTGAGHPTQAE